MKTKRIFSTLIAVLACLAVGLQYYLLAENRTTGLGEATIRFFSFFTILTNTLVAIVFTALALRRTAQGGTLTAVTVYIIVVGLVYQVLLRHIWQPKGLQMVVDELLHTVVPLLVLVFWWMYGRYACLRYRDIWRWLVYPLVYLFWILARGSFSGFYPYPFVNVSELGMQTVIVHAGGLMIFFMLLSAAFIGVTRRRRQTGSV